MFASVTGAEAREQGPSIAACGWTAARRSAPPAHGAIRYEPC
jgi:hypothetical protein